MAMLAASVVMINLGFGLIYWLIGGLGGAAATGGFGNAVFFSVQSFSTTGYGAVYPQSLGANIVASVEIITGLLMTALATGLLFARISRPQARVLFSRIGVIHATDGVPTLMFRVANQRRNQLTEARMSVTLVRDERDAAGATMRRLTDLALVRDRSPAFAISWTVMHRITADSPLAGATADSLAAVGATLLCVLSGLDDTLLATVTARHVYAAGDIRFGHRFADIMSQHDDGGITIDYTRFHDSAPHPGQLAP